MNREDTRKAAEVMLAYANGAEIEFSYTDYTVWNKFCPDGTPTWDFGSYKYRVAKSDGERLYEAYQQRENLSVDWKNINYRSYWESVAKAAKEVFK